MDSDCVIVQQERAATGLEFAGMFLYDKFILAVALFLHMQGGLALLRKQQYETPSQ